MSKIDSVAQRAQASLNVNPTDSMMAGLLDGPGASNVSSSSRSPANAHPDAASAIALMNNLVGAADNGGNGGGARKPTLHS